MTEFNGVEGVWCIYGDVSGFPQAEFVHIDLPATVMAHAAIGYGKIAFWPFGMEISVAVDHWTRLVANTDMGPGNVGRMYEEAMEAFKTLIGFQEENPPEENPHLPKPPEDGRHIFGTDGTSYRCSRCGVYNRPDVPTTKEVLDKPCEGRWAQSGKLRHAAEEQWMEDKRGGKEG